MTIAAQLLLISHRFKFLPPSSWSTVTCHYTQLNLWSYFCQVFVIRYISSWWVPVLYFFVLTKLLLLHLVFKFCQRYSIFSDKFYFSWIFHEDQSWGSTIFCRLAVRSCPPDFIFSWDWMPNFHLKWNLMWKISFPKLNQAASESILSFY